MATKKTKLPTALSRDFFDRDPPTVGRELLGKVLVRRDAKALLLGRIVEVEAYLGENDPAAHSAVGCTPRNAVMFGPPGFAYVYFIYGNHYCLNVSCLPAGTAGAVLFRAVEPIAGIDEMAEARGVEVETPRDLYRLTSGPGRIAEAFGVTRERDNGKDLTDARSDIYIGDDGFQSAKIISGTRIGISKAAHLPLRYFLPGNPFVSGPKALSRKTSPSQQ